MQELGSATAPSEQTGLEQEIAALRARLVDLEQMEREYRQLFASQPEQAKNQEAYQRLQFVLNSITDSYVSFDRKWHILAVNAVAEKMIFQRPAVELIGKVMWEVFPLAKGTEFYRQYHIAFDENRPVHFEGHSQISGKWYEAHAYPNGDTLEVFLRDITPGKQALEALEQGQKEYRLLAETASLTAAKLAAVIDSMVEGIIILEPSGTVVSMNKAATNLLSDQTTRREPLSEINDIFALFDCTYPDGSPCPYEEWPAVRAAGGETISMQELIVKHKPTGACWLGMFSATPVFDPTGEVMLLVCSMMDMTDHHRILEQNQRAALQIELQRMLIQEREDERIKIARELHDGPLQHLVGLEYELNEALRIDNKVERLAMLARLRTDLQQAAQVLRNYCADLRPPSLAVFGLEKAIRSHAEQVNRKIPQLRIRLELMEDGQQLSQQMRMTLFRIYQELMNNVIRHSKASEVSVQLSLDEAQTELEIQDNGVGFLLPTQWIELARQNHFGLVGVQERADAAGGKVIMRSQPGQGTLVRVIVPCEQVVDQIIEQANEGVSL